MIHCHPFSSWPPRPSLSRPQADQIPRVRPTRRTHPPWLCVEHSDTGIQWNCWKHQNIIVRINFNFLKKKGWVVLARRRIQGQCTVGARNKKSIRSLFTTTFNEYSQSYFKLVSIHFRIYIYSLRWKLLLVATENDNSHVSLARSPSSLLFILRYFSPLPSPRPFSVAWYTVPLYPFSSSMVPSPLSPVHPEAGTQPWPCLIQREIPQSSVPLYSFTLSGLVLRPIFPLHPPLIWYSAAALSHSPSDLSPYTLFNSPPLGLVLSPLFPVHPLVLYSAAALSHSPSDLSPSTLFTFPPPALGPGTRLADSLIRRPSILCLPLCSANLMLVDHKAYCFQSAYTIITGSSEREQCPGDECWEAS